MIPIPIKIPDDKVAPIKLMPVIPSCITITPGNPSAAPRSIMTAPSAPPSAMKE